MDNAKKQYFKVDENGQYELPIKPDKELFVSNYMNSVGFPNFTSLEMDVFYTLCAVLSNTEDRVYKLNLTDFFKSMGKRGYSDEEIYTIIDEMTDKFADKKVFCNQDGKKIKGSLFIVEQNLDEQYINVEVPRLMRHLINDLHSNFTKIEMKEFLSLRSVNAKKLYRLIRQYDDLGIVKIKIKDFYSCMGIDEEKPFKYVDRDVLNPSVKELEKVFVSLSVTKGRNTRKKGHPIEVLTFSWTPRRSIVEEKEEADIRTKKKLQKAKAVQRDIEQKHPELAENTHIPTSKTKKNSFADFEQRSYDFDEFEKKYVFTGKEADDEPIKGQYYIDDINCEIKEDKEN